MDVSVVFPGHIDASVWTAVGQEPPSPSASNNLEIHVWWTIQSRFFCRELVPLVRQSDRIVFRRFLQLLRRSQDDGFSAPFVINAVQTHCIRHRRDLCCRRLKRRMNKEEDQAPIVLCWIEPEGTTMHESTFAGRLLHWEHQLIRAQSLAGYFATLGGGYFMCHHWKTAVRLAKQQQRMASFVGDRGMFYKCLLNQAYNHIYATHFGRANRLIRLVYTSVAAESGHFSDRTVLLNMCRSAHLFGRRVRQAHIMGDVEHRVVDDFARIRLIPDQSSEKDRLVVV